MKFQFRMRWSWVAPIEVEIAAEFEGRSYREQSAAALQVITERHAKWRRGEEDGTRADLTDANLTDADLTRADLTDANLTRADLTRADLTDANLTDADLTRANLTDANLTRADLTRADLTDANLTRADLTRADLTDANLTDADLTRANLTDANLTDANLTDARIYDKAGNEIRVRRPPLILHGLDYRVIVWEQHMQIGCELHSLADWRAFNDRRIAAMDGPRARRFWDRHKAALLALAESDGRGAEEAEQPQERPQEDAA